ncbi:MAG TPA: NADH-quinone oxidoreductase subunit H, partial [Candidatus Marinimicrobia bacterium]|nr:NADH-quinone oxidoreductase subunit H [Candidatus Neomarinimicrobiota bacterium]
MTSILDSLVKSFSSFNLDIAVILPVVTLIGGTVIFLIMAVNALIAVYFERKISAFMQDRLGPMEVGIFGFKGGKKFWGGIGQTLADAVKLLVKEDILPNNADKFLMILA